jgi:hypothetical protein
MMVSDMRGECIATSEIYSTGSAVPLLTSKTSDVYKRQPKGLDKLKVNGILLDDPFPCGPSDLDRILRRVSIQGTSEAEIMKLTRIYSPSDDQYEYDIAIPLPPPIRRYKVKLNIKTIKKGKPTIVDPDWI